jgi:hypothetical protein
MIDATAPSGVISGNFVGLSGEFYRDNEQTPLYAVNMPININKLSDIGYAIMQGKIA